MLQFFGILAFLAARAQTPPKIMAITAENGKVVVQSGDARFWAERISSDAGQPTQPARFKP